MDVGMQISETRIKDLYVITPPAQYLNDHECVYETYNPEVLKKFGLNLNFVQDNESFSKKGVLRGLHVQQRFPQGKLIRVVQGQIFDVAVDMRKDSSSYLEWFGIELSNKNRKQLYIPEGFAHGFFVMSEHALVSFKVSDHWHPNDELGIPWNDPTLKIEWPLKEGEMPIMLEKDMLYNPLKI